MKPTNQKHHNEEIKQAEVREKLVLPYGKDRMEVVSADDCELISENGKLYLVRTSNKTIHFALKVTLSHNRFEKFGGTSGLLKIIQDSFDECVNESDFNFEFSQVQV